MDYEKLIDELDKLRFEKKRNPDIAKVYADVNCDKLIEKYMYRLYYDWQECKENVFDDCTSDEKPILPDPEDAAE